MGLIDTQAKAHSARTLLARHRLALVTANCIASDETTAWTLAANPQGGPM